MLTQYFQSLVFMSHCIYEICYAISNTKRQIYHHILCHGYLLFVSYLSYHEQFSLSVISLNHNYNSGCINQSHTHTHTRMWWWCSVAHTRIVDLTRMLNNSYLNSIQFAPPPGLTSFPTG